MAILSECVDKPAWDAWVASRPQVIQDMIARCPPNRLYRIDSGHRVTIYSYNEASTVTVDVTGQFNRVVFGRRVFGIPIAELVECDLPAPDEDVGDTSAEAGLTKKDVREIVIPAIREMWERSTS